MTGAATKLQSLLAHRAPPPAFVDLEIRILERRDQGYPVEITLHGREEFPRGFLPVEAVPWVPTSSPQADGERLFRLLLSDPKLAAAWAEVRGRSPTRRVRLRLDASAPELHTLPWELLRDVSADPPRLLAADPQTPFSRYLAGLSHSSPVRVRPLRILVAAAGPQGLEDYGLPPLDPAAEWRELQEAVAGIPPGELELTLMPPPVTLARLEEELRHGYHGLHLICHGTFSRQRQRAALFLEGKEGWVERVGEEEFTAMAARLGGEVRLMTLAACQSATRSPADAFVGLAPRLVAAGLPAVVAMQDRVPLASAREWTGAFYRRLLAHGQVDLATNEARSALLAARLPGAAVPAVFLRLRDGTLLAPPPRRRWHQAAVALLSILALAAAGLSAHLLRRTSEHATESLASGLAVEARACLGTQPDLALLLSVEAADLAGTKVGRDSLLAALGACGEPLYQVLAGHRGAVTGLAFSRDGRLLASGGEDGWVLLHDTVTGQTVGEPLELGEAVRLIAFSPDGGGLAVAVGDGRVRLWDANGSPRPGSPLGSGDTTALSFRPGGTALASGDRLGGLRLWEVAAARSLGPPVVSPGGSVAALAFDPTGRMLASGDQEGGVDLWKVVGEALQPLRPRLGSLGSPVASLVFTPAGDYLVAVAENGRLQPWDTATGEPVGDTLDSYLGGVRGAAMSADGATFALGGLDGTLLLGDVATRTRLGAPLPGPGPALIRAAFSPVDSATLATGGEDGGVLLWNLRLEALRIRACRRAGRNLSHDEWQRFVGSEVPYRLTCPELPGPPP